MAAENHIADDRKKVRLIDANALGIGRCNPDLLPFGNRPYAAGWNGVVNLIENAPTVDAVEVVHGRWEILDGYVRCSVCGQIMDEDYNYCPNCGAKMDGEE